MIDVPDRLTIIPAQEWEDVKRELGELKSRRPDSPTIIAGLLSVIVIESCAILLLFAILFRW